MVALKLEAGVIVHVPAVLKLRGPFTSRFQLVMPLTAGDTTRMRPVTAGF
jgi:hypothetical protein